LKTKDKTNFIASGKKFKLKTYVSSFNFKNVGRAIGVFLYLFNQKFAILLVEITAAAPHQIYFDYFQHNKTKFKDFVSLG